MNDNLQRLIALAKADGGKFFVIDEQGIPQLVIMGIADYEQVLIKKAHGALASQVNSVSNPVTSAQVVPQAVVQNSEPVQPALQKQFSEQGQNSKDFSKQSHFVQEDLRSEVIDSTFSFEDVNSESVPVDAYDEI